MYIDHIYRCMHKYVCIYDYTYSYCIYIYILYIHFQVMAETWKGMTLWGSPYDPYVREVWKTLGTADEGTNREQGFDS